MRRTLPVLLLLVIALAVSSCTDADDDDGDPLTGDPFDAETETALADALAGTMATYEVPGAVVLVTVPGEGTWIADEGLADASTQTAPTTDMRFPIRSVTKSFTVTALLQLVEEGRVNLDDTVSMYVGAPNGDQITLRELAFMSAGLGEYAANPTFQESLFSDLDRVFTIEELNEYGFEQPILFEPGAEHVYINTNTNVVGQIIEQQTGQPIGEVLAERILEPLGLSDTVYAETLDDWAQPQPVGYWPGDAGLEPAPQNFSAFGPAGAMVSTLEDLARWAPVLASGELVGDELQDEREEAAPLDSGPEYDAYGLGIGEIDGWWGHTGEGFGFTSLVMHDEESGGTVVALMNASNLTDADGAPVHAPTAFFREAAQILGED